MADNSFNTNENEINKTPEAVTGKKKEKKEKPDKYPMVLVKKRGLLAVSPSPHIKSRTNARRLMFDVIIALLPAAAWGVYVFGYRALTVLLLSVAGAVLSELIFELLLHRPITLGDLSAIVTGLLLGMNLPASAPFWMPLLGSAFAIIIVKQLFGGIGKNFLNPALAARVFLFASWPSFMTDFTTPNIYETADAVASATPLGALKQGLLPSSSILDMFLGKTGGVIGEVSTLLLLVGGIYLLVRRVITWHIPVSFIGITAIVTFVFSKSAGSQTTFMLAELCAGGLMLGAFFMATDYTTSPVTPVGRLIFGAGCGLITVFIRYFGGYPEGVSFAILIMNTLIWYIEKITKPKVFGVTKPKKEKKKKEKMPENAA